MKLPTDFFHVGDLVEFRPQEDIDYLIDHKLVRTISIEPTYRKVGGLTGRIKNISGSDSIEIEVPGFSTFHYDFKIVWFPRKYGDPMKGD